jgi:hypothetical protein
VPRPHNECEHKSDEVEVEEVQHVAEDRGEHDLALIIGQ